MTGILILPLSMILIMHFWTILTVWYFELFWQCGILNYSDSVVFWTILTVWYFELFWVWYFELFWQCGILNYSDSVVLFNYSDSVVFFNYSDSVVFLLFILFFQCCRIYKACSPFISFHMSIKYYNYLHHNTK